MSPAAGPETPPRLDPRLHVDPLTLYARLRAGDPPWMIDLRPAGARPRLLGSESPIETSPEALLERLVSSPGDRPLFLIDADGVVAAELARVLRTAGHEQVRALYGGVALYDFVLDPEVVSGDRFLR